MSMFLLTPSLAESPDGRGLDRERSRGHQGRKLSLRVHELLDHQVSDIRKARENSLSGSRFHSYITFPNTYNSITARESLRFDGATVFRADPRPLLHEHLCIVTCSLPLPAQF